MADKLKVRNISPLLQMWRNFLLGREHVPERASLRYTALVSKKDQPPPVLPEGEAHKLSANHYCKRDGRREAAPPIVVIEGSSTKQISAGAAVEGQGKKGPVTPGKFFEYS